MFQERGNSLTEQALTLNQKLKISLVFTAVNLLWFVDDFFSFLRGATVNTGRLALYLVLISTFFQAFTLEYKPLNLSLFSYVSISPQSQVLGISNKASAVPLEKKDIPFLNTDTPFPEITSKIVFVKDIRSNKILFTKSADLRQAPASTAKLMTALVALDIYKTTDVITIPEICTLVEGQKNGFQTGEKYMFEELMGSMLINSSADAACSLALSKVSYSNFVALMNKKAEEYSMNSTKFTNPVGLDDANGGQYTTAEDLYTLAMFARKNSLIKKLVATRETTIKSEPLKNPQLNEDLSLVTETYVTNTNRLLWDIPGTVGIKTGKTEAAGEVLIYEYAQANKDLIIIVMGSQDRFTDTSNILNWVLTNYTWDDKASPFSTL